MHCDVVQGFFFSQPLSEDDFLQWINIYPNIVESSNENITYSHDKKPYLQ